MKIYIGNRQINDDSYKTITEPQILEHLAEDSECTVIAIDNILKRYTIESVTEPLDLIVKKLRIGGLLILNDIDFELLSFVYQNNPDIVGLNQMVSSSGGFNMLLTVDLVKQMLARYSELKLVSSKINGLEFTLEYKREV